jgi:DNA-binding NtrC family response regulator
MEHPGESAASTGGTVLIAEDEEIVRTLAATALERAGFLVLPACNGEAALEIFRNGGANIDALLTDVQMGSGITGIALAERVLMERPEIAVLVMSGFPEAELLARERNLCFLAKPFTPAKLVERMRQVLASNTPAHSGSR